MLLDESDTSKDATEHHEHDVTHVLRVPITIDRTGWLRGEIDVLYNRSATGFRPVCVKIGQYALLEDVRAIGDVYVYFDRYNGALARLHGLRIEQVDRDIDKRQREYMGHGTVRLRTLLRELEYLDALVERYDPVVSPSPIAPDDPRAEEPPRCR